MMHLFNQSLLSGIISTGVSILAFIKGQNKKIPLFQIFHQHIIRLGGLTIASNCRGCSLFLSLHDHREYKPNALL